MMPNSARRRTRREAETQKSDAEPVDSLHTPTRKRRRVNGSEPGAPAAPAASTAPTASAVSTAAGVPSASSKSKSQQSAGSEETADNSGPENGDENDHENENGNANENENEDIPSLADEVIRHLRVAGYGAVVTQTYNNSLVDPSATAFAKIAGRDWTFYVSKVKVMIGRPITKKSDNLSWQAQPPDVDIDLGPDQQVSRVHAEIGYDGEESMWFIFVNGRNGCYVDDVRIEAGSRTWLHSGNVINILGSQMMFLLPDTVPDIHPCIRRQLVVEDETEPEMDSREAGGSTASVVRPCTRASNNKTSPQAVTSGVPMSSFGTHNSLETPTSKAKSVSATKNKTSPMYHRGVVMDSAEDIDYSLDTAKDIKPPHSYATMIGQAILSTPEEKATLAQIYEYIKERYAYFRHSGAGWQNSIRHNLSLSKSFEKVPRRTDEPGKGMKWQIVAEHRDEFMKKNMQPMRRGQNIGSSAPNSPASNLAAAAQTERLIGLIGKVSSSKKREHTVTPPLSSYPGAPESHTPDRGPQASFPASGQLPQALVNQSPPVGPDTTPTHNRAGDGATANPSNRADSFRLTGYNSPPTLASLGYDGQFGGHLFTPLPARSRSIAAIQSTCKAPSFYAKDLFSSPAPFFKFAEIGSTPARLPGLSPLKSARKSIDESMTATEQADDTNTEEDEPMDLSTRDGIKPALNLHPSSPPADTTEAADTSPSTTVSRPVSRPVSRRLEPELAKALPAKNADEVATRVLHTRAEHASSSKLANPKDKTTPPLNSSSDGALHNSASPPSCYNKGPPALMALSTSAALASRAPVYSKRMEIDDDDDEDFDLTRGFEKIGSFHHTMQAHSLSR